MNIKRTAFVPQKSGVNCHPDPIRTRLTAMMDRGRIAPPQSNFKTSFNRFFRIPAFPHIAPGILRSHSGILLAMSGQAQNGGGPARVVKAQSANFDKRSSDAFG